MIIGHNFLNIGIFLKFIDYVLMSRSVGCTLQCFHEVAETFGSLRSQHVDECFFATPGRCVTKAYESVVFICGQDVVLLQPHSNLWHIKTVHQNFQVIVYDTANCINLSMYAYSIKLTLYCNSSYTPYRIAGNFRGIQFSRKGHLQRFCDLIFMDGRSRIKNVGPLFILQI